MGLAASRRRARGKAAELDDRPDLDRPLARRGDLPGDRDRLVEARGVDQEVAAELLAGLGERAVGHEPLAVADADAGGRRDRLERRRRQVLAVLVELAGQLDRLAVAPLALGVGPGVLVAVD